MGIMENNMQATMVYCSLSGIMENKMEATICIAVAPYS